MHPHQRGSVGVDQVRLLAEAQAVGTTVRTLRLQEALVHADHRDVHAHRILYLEQGRTQEASM